MNGLFFFDDKFFSFQGQQAYCVEFTRWALYRSAKYKSERFLARSNGQPIGVPAFLDLFEKLSKLSLFYY